MVMIDTLNRNTEGLNNSNIERVLNALEQSEDREQFNIKIEGIKKESIRNKVRDVCKGYSNDDFDLYKAWLKARLVKLKQLNRIEESKRRCGE
jgi:hypothetical protein